MRANLIGLATIAMKVACPRTDSVLTHSEVPVSDRPGLQGVSGKLKQAK